MPKGHATLMAGYYKPGPERPEKVRQLFAQIARRYDLINDIQSFGLHRWWKKRVVTLARVTPGQKALDLCTGTGDLALRLADAGAAVTGCDFTPEMLRRAAERDSNRIAWIQGDALKLPFPDASFDLITVGYGLRNLADFEGGLREMVRVLRPGGRLVILEFGKPPNAVWRSLYYGYLRLFVPVFGLVFCGNPAAYAYILESLLHYPGQEEVAAFLRNYKCQEVGVHNLLGGVMSINSAVKV